MDKFLWRTALWCIAIGIILIVLGSCNLAHAKQPSLLCKTRDSKEYIDIVSTGGTGALVQINGGDFLEGTAEFEDPMLYVAVPLTNGTFGVVFDVKERQGVAVLKADGKKQVHEMDCIFRD
jgi:hypothetical protein